MTAGIRAIKPQVPAGRYSLVSPPDLAMLIRGEAFPCARTRVSLSSPFWTEVAAPAGAAGCPVAFGGPWPLLFGVPRRAEL